MIELTGNTGTLIKAYDYDAFGNEVNPDPADTNPFRYCSEYFDKETGTIYLRARYYDPGIGRFILEDSVWGKGNDSLSLNLYSYCNNNPIMFIDPSGHIGIMPDGSIYMTDGDTVIDKQLVQLKRQYSNATSDYERQRIANEAKILRVNNPNQWHVNSEKSLDYYTITDVTKKLNDLMRSNREKFEKHSWDFIWFKNNVGYNRLFDIKTQSEWQYEHVIYDGEVLRGDAPGNISYGYLGKAAHFSDFTLRLAAGIAQQFSNAGQPVDRKWIFTNWGDAPGDWEFIGIGIEIWRKNVMITNGGTSY